MTVELNSIITKQPKISDVVLVIPSNSIQAYKAMYILWEENDSLFSCWHIPDNPKELALRRCHKNDKWILLSELTEDQL